MQISRNSVELLRRLGLVEETARPKPRFDPAALLVHTVPLGDPPKPVQPVLIQLEGHPPPDRGLSRGWPGQTVPESR